MATINEFRTQMSTPSNWPLSPASVRYLVPTGTRTILAQHQISQMLYPTAFGYYEHAAGHHIVRNRHDDHLLLFCVDGQGRLKVNGEQLNIAAGQAVVLPQGVAHEYYAHHSHPWTLYWVHFDGSNIPSFLSLLPNETHSPYFLLDTPNEFETIFRDLLACRQVSYQSTIFIKASTILQRLLIELSIQYPDKNANMSLTRFEQVDYYLRENIAKSLTLDDMAMAFGLSKFYFAKKFQKTVGVSPVRYFTEKKIHFACKLLDSGDQSIKSIAAQLGYDDAYYFSRLFKNIMGLSPSQYRKSGQGR